MYQLEFSKKAVKNLVKIDRKYQKIIIEKLELLSINPFESSNVKALKGETNLLVWTKI